MAKKKVKKTVKSKGVQKKSKKSTGSKAAKKTVKAKKSLATKSAKKTSSKPRAKISPKGSAKSASAQSKSSLPEAQVKVGQFVPEFSLPATGGQNVDIHALKGKKVVLYFYPKDATPGCTIEGHDFTKLKNEFDNANTIVYGVSRDSMSSHEKFKQKECYTVDLISDEKEELCGVFGVIKMKNMYGKQVRGIERSTFVVDTTGSLVKEWRGVKVDGHANEVLEFVKSI